jgi:membrane glycosyltransferase
LFLPKLLSILLIYAKGAKEYGGPIKVTLSMIIEVLCSMLLAPVRMLFHTRFVVAAFLGWSVQWKSPQREDGATSWGDAIRAHGGQTLLGIAWAALVGWLDPVFLWWLAPIVVALMLSIPVSVITSRVSIGRSMRSSNIFLIPEEYDTPKALVATDEYTQANRASPLEDGFLRAIVAPSQNALAVAMATSRHKTVPAIERVREERIKLALSSSPDKLPAPMRLNMLSDPAILSQLHAAIWQDNVSTWIEPWRKLKRSEGHTSDAETDALTKAPTLNVGNV